MKFRIDYPKDNIGPIFFEFSSKDGKLHENIKCFGSIRYPDLSVYAGPLIYKNGKGNKLGYGQQDFSAAHVFSSDEVGLDSSYKLYRYVGMFDYRKTDWIYGDGVLYFVDQFNQPKAFMKANWFGLRPTGKYTQKFDYSLLLLGFSKEMEISYHKAVPHLFRYTHVLSLAKKAKQKDLLLIGDSWFEFYEKGPEEETTGDYLIDSKDKNVINLGIGGSTFGDWNFYIDRIGKVIKFNRVIINLGYNDVHFVPRVEAIYQDFKVFVKKLKALNKDVVIFVNEVSVSPLFTKDYSRTYLLNKKLSSYCESHSNLKFLEVCKTFNDKNISNKELVSYFGNDLIHLNKVGSKIWKSEFIKEFK